VETQVIVSETDDTVSRHLAVAAATQNVDAVVMSTHGRSSVTGWLLGSVADQVVRNIDRPVLLVSAGALAARATGQMCVGDVMTRDVLTLQENETLIVALRKLVHRQASGAPVLDANGLLVGVISQRDVMGWYERTVGALAKQSVPSPDEYLRRLRSERVGAVMTTPPTSIQESASLGSALTLLQSRGIHRVPITREGRVVGILTGSDVLLALLAQIETTQESNRRAELQPMPAALTAVHADG
jgi:CBS domain-containing protein